tara:strand:- start:57 stop:419 length:363 start_codon:yes stop_codon:yes gene_type:complete
MKEYHLQKAVCKYLELNKVLYCASLGGQYQIFRSQRIKAKASGYKKGFPDIFIYESSPCGKYHGLAIELKVGYNKPTKEQLWWCERLNKRAYLAKVCTGLDETIETINNYFKGKNNANKP